MEKPSDEDMSVDLENLLHAVKFGEVDCSHFEEMRIRAAIARAIYAESELATAQARNAVLEGLLREVEWSKSIQRPRSSLIVLCCPICFSEARDGHATDCRWAAAMRKEPTR